MSKPDAVTRFRVAAAEVGFAVEPNRFPEGTRTAADAAAAIGCDVAQIVKSLVFTTADGPILALTSGANTVDTDRLGEVIGTAVGKADAEAVRAATGFVIGGTPPFGHVGLLPTYLDRDLLEHETVWAAAGTPDSVFPIAPRRLMELARAEIADFVTIR